MSLYRRTYTLKSGQISATWSWDFEHGKRRYRGSFGHCTATAAKARYARKKAEILEGRWRLKPDAVPSLSVYLEEFMAWYSGHAAPASVRRYAYAAKALIPILGACRWFELDDRRVDEYRRQRLTLGRSAVSVNREVGMLTHALRTSVRWKQLEAYPLRDIRKLRELSRMRILSDLEEEHLLLACRDSLRSVVIVALDTGFRESELASLTRLSVQVGERLLTVVNAYAKVRETRTLEMTGRVWLTVEARLQVIPERDRETPLLGYGQASSIKRAFRKARHRAGLGDVRFHDLRHTFATRMLLSGVDLVKVQHMLGHKTVTMTMRYLTLTGGDTRGILSRLTRVQVPPKSPAVDFRESGERLET